MALCRLIHADATLWACAWTTVEDRRGLKNKVGTTSGAHIAKGEYANDADCEKREDGHPKVISEPGMGSPTPGQYADDHQARPQKQEPGSKRLPDGGHGLEHLLIETHSAAGARVRTPDTSPESFLSCRDTSLYDLVTERVIRRSDKLPVASVWYGLESLGPVTTYESAKQFADVRAFE
jgi:hypothetical protein